MRSSFEFGSIDAVKVRSATAELMCSLLPLPSYLSVSPANIDARGAAAGCANAAPTAAKHKMAIPIDLKRAGFIDSTKKIRLCGQNADRDGAAEGRPILPVLQV